MYFSRKEKEPVISSYLAVIVLYNFLHIHIIDPKIIVIITCFMNSFMNIVIIHTLLSIKEYVIDAPCLIAKRNVCTGRNTYLDHMEYLT